MVGAEDPYYWVSSEVCEASSEIDSHHVMLKLLKEVEIARSEDNQEFECLPYSLEDRVYDSQDLKDAEFVYMYKTLFKDLVLRLPFTEFERGVLVQINVASTQLHRNSWAFVHYFKVLMEFLGQEPCLNMFFSFFQEKGIWKGMWCCLNVVLG